MGPLGEVPRHTLLAPLASPCFVLCLIGVETEDCTVQPSPGHNRCRKTVFVAYFLALFKSPSGGGLTKMGSVTF